MELNEWILYFLQDSDRIYERSNNVEIETQRLCDLAMGGDSPPCEWKSQFNNEEERSRARDVYLAHVTVSFRHGRRV